MINFCFASGKSFIDFSRIVSLSTNIKGLIVLKFSFLNLLPNPAIGIII